MDKLTKACAVLIPIGLVVSIAGGILMAVSEQPDFEAIKEVTYEGVAETVTDTTVIYSENDDLDDYDIPGSISYNRDEAYSIVIDCTAASMNIYKNPSGYAIESNDMPQKYLSMECTDGTITVKYNQKNLSDFDSGSLDIGIPDTCKNITIRCNAGDISVSDFIGESIDISVSCGNIEISDSNINTSCKINNTLGNVSIDESVVCGLEAELVSGNIEVYDSSLNNNNVINVDVGNCDVKLNGNESDYSFNVSVKVGEVDCDHDLSGSHQSNNQVNISVIAGNCTIDFND